MAPHASSSSSSLPPSSSDSVITLEAPPLPPQSLNPPRILIIGAGSRGNAYARATERSTNGVVVAVADPVKYKRERLGETYIWGKNPKGRGVEFDGWESFVAYELARRERAAKVERGESDEVVEVGVDAVFVCTLDEQHLEVILGLEPLGLHIMCEKPLATRLEDCVRIYNSLTSRSGGQDRIFSIGHVLRYSPHNMLLRKLLLEERVIGEVLSINHTEPVGWWHFSHSYVRGNWRKESTTAPSLLTKSCHDIDLILWLLCSPPPGSTQPAHIPSTVSSSGALQYFNTSRKPKAALDATNCLACPIEESCKHSAKKIYLGPEHKGLASGNTDWPVNIVLPEIEECISLHGQSGGSAALLQKLKEDYTDATPQAEVDRKNYFGRCVYEADNDVCDDQVVTMTWDNDPLPATASSSTSTSTRGAKTAIFHMVSHTTKICERYSHIYGSEGEIYADSETITVEDFNTNTKRTYKPHMAGGGHGGGDDGLARQFILAVDAVKNGGVGVEEAQGEHVGCSLEEVIRSHAMVFAAEEARRGKKVLDFPDWWKSSVEGKLRRE